MTVTNGSTDPRSTSSLILEQLPNGEHAWLRPIVVQPNPAPQSSVELSQTAKGATQVCCKVYGSDPEAAMVEAIRLYDQLVKRYAQP